MKTRIVSLVSRELHREVVVGRRGVAAIAVGATVVCLTLAAEARMYLPFTAVPVTLQTFFVLVAGVALGPRLGTLSLSAYLLVGAAGLPVFTGQWLGPTTGYLVGFVVAGWLVGKLTRAVPQAGTLRIVVAMAAGSAVIYAFGVPYYACWRGLSLPQAIVEGCVYFLPGDAAKLAAAAAFCRSYRERLRALFP